MKLTDYYKFERLSGCKSKMRVDCVASTSEYAPFEATRNKQGALFCYIGGNPHRKNRARKSDLSITNSKGENISSIYVPDIELSLAYGDMNHTTDAILILFKNFSRPNSVISEGSEIEIVIARGQRNNCSQLFTLFTNGELDNELQALRERAKADPNPTLSIKG